MATLVQGRFGFGLYEESGRDIEQFGAFGKANENSKNCFSFRAHTLPTM